MKKRIFISATGTDIGKTYATLLLIESLAKKGFSVGVSKPIETGVENANSIGQDTYKLYEKCKNFNPKFQNVDIDIVNPYRFSLPAAPYIAKKDDKIDTNKIEDTIKFMEQFCDIVLIEGAGGLYVPIDENFFMIDLAKHLNAKVLLISHSKLGCINDTILSIKALESYGLEYIFAINLFLPHNLADSSTQMAQSHNFSQISQPFFEKNFNKFFLLEQDIDKIVNELIYIS